MTNPMAVPEPTWVDRYHRALLDFVGAPAEIDLTTVQVSSSWSDAYRYSEYTGGEAQFDLDVSWQSATQERPWERPDVDGKYRHTRGLSNEEVVRFLNSIV